MFKKSITYLRHFFMNYLWLGICLILLGIIISEEFPKPNAFVSIVIELLKTVGISIMVAAVFSFAAGTSDFTERIRKLLQEIVVTRKFLCDITPASKKLALKSLLRPSESETNRYSEIDEYYELYISKTLDIAKLTVRGDYHLTGTAFVDRVENKVAMNLFYSYRLFPGSAGFGGVQIAFYEEDVLSRCEKIIVSTPDGDREVIDTPVLKNEKYGKIVLRKFTHDLSAYDGKFQHLDIEMNVVEYGFDHWLLYEFQALHPTNGFKFTLRCTDNLEVKKSLVFVIDANYHVEKHEHDVFSISCNQWITEGSGLAVTVGPKGNTSG